MFQKGPLMEYVKLIEKQALKANQKQYEAAQLLQTLFNQIQNYNPRPLFHQKVHSTSWFGKLQNSFRNNIINAPSKGLYIYGGTGTGKSMLMDIFYHSMETKRKHRVHFHAFMLDIHQRAHQLRTEGNTDPIPNIAFDLANNAWLLCFDEFQVTDIADAMLLKRLCGMLFDYGVIMVTTSNRHPTELYYNGIQRASFLPTIDLLQQKCIVHNLDGGIDFRKENVGQVKVYFNSNDCASLEQMQVLWNRLVDSNKVKPKSIQVWGRTMNIEKSFYRIARTSFRELCGTPLSAADYLALCKEIDVLFLDDIPQLDLDTRNEARRLITLIDTLYDNRIKLIASFATSIDNIFVAKNSLGSNGAELKELDEIFAFHRCLSRFMEMRTRNWWGTMAEKID
jgi:protein AFG1